jgi:hypothetical protein
MYFPKSQIIPDLYTNGKEFISFKDETPYIGHYYRTSDGKYYTGRNPEDGANNRLMVMSPGHKPPVTKNSKIQTRIDGSEPVGENMYIIDTDYYISKGYKSNRGDAPRLPKSHSSKPLEEDYIQNEFERFFVKKSNEAKFLEVSKDEYTLFKTKDKGVQCNLYIPIKILWTLTGNKTEVYNLNKKVVNLVEKKDNVLGFTSYFKGKFDKYWRAQ